MTRDSVYIIRQTPDVIVSIGINSFLVGTTKYIEVGALKKKKNPFPAQEVTFTKCKMRADCAKVTKTIAPGGNSALSNSGLLDVHALDLGVFC